MAVPWRSDIWIDVLKKCKQINQNFRLWLWWRGGVMPRTSPRRLFLYLLCVVRWHHRGPANMLAGHDDDDDDILYLNGWSLWRYQTITVLLSGLVLVANVHHALFTSLPLQQQLEHTTKLTPQVMMGRIMIILWRISQYSWSLQIIHLGVNNDMFDHI